MKTGSPHLLYRHLLVCLLVACLMLLCACRTPPPSAPQAISPAPAPTTPEVLQDDIPADASPAVRAHLIKLREMRDVGQISDGEYQSRKAALLKPWLKRSHLGRDCLVWCHQGEWIYLPRGGGVQEAAHVSENPLPARASRGERAWAWALGEGRRQLAHSSSKG